MGGSISGSPQLQKASEDGAYHTFSEHFLCGKVLGEGGFGTVLAVKSKQDQQTYAAKMIERGDEVSIKDVEHEARLLRISQHPCTIAFHGIYAQEGCLFLIMDLYQGGSYTAGLRKHWASHGLVPVPVVQNMAKMMVMATAWLHGQGIIHRDLKTDNILLNHGELQHPECRSFLSDFGSACELKADQKLTTKVGTRAFWAPELRKQQPYSNAIDIWALGKIIQISMFSRSFDKEGTRQGRPDKCRALQDGELLLRGMLEESETTRVTAEQALEHTFLSSVKTVVETEMEADARKGHIIFKMVGAADMVKVGSDAGSGARMDLALYEYRSGDWLMLGHSGNSHRMLVVKPGPMVKEATGWRRVWNDKWSGNFLDYDVYVPTCGDPDFLPLGCVCVFRTQNHQQPPPGAPFACVHKSALETVALGEVAWKGAGSWASSHLTLNAVPGLGTMWPSVSSMHHPGQAHKIRSELLASSVQSSTPAEAEAKKELDLHEGDLSRWSTGVPSTCSTRSELESDVGSVPEDVSLDSRDEKDLDMLLLQAVAAGTAMLVRGLVERGADPYLLTEGLTYLMIAAECGHVEVVRYLLETCCLDIDGKDDIGSTALEMAAASGRSEVVRYLLAMGADVGNLSVGGCTPLHAAVRGGHLDTLRYLVECESGASLLSPLEYNLQSIAAEQGHLHILSYLSAFGEICDKEKRQRRSQLTMSATAALLWSIPPSISLFSIEA